MNKETTTSNPILTGSIYKSILMFFFPILLGSFLQQLYSTTDALIAGRYVNKEANQNVYNIARGSYSCKGFLVDITPYYKSICCTVELLQK